MVAEALPVSFGNGGSLLGCLKRGPLLLCHAVWMLPYSLAVKPTVTERSYTYSPQYSSRRRIGLVNNRLAVTVRVARGPPSSSATPSAALTAPKTGACSGAAHHPVVPLSVHLVRPSVQYAFTRTTSFFGSHNDRTAHQTVNPTEKSKLMHEFVARSGELNLVS